MRSSFARVSCGSAGGSRRWSAGQLGTGWSALVGLTRSGCPSPPTLRTLYQPIASCPGAPPPDPQPLAWGRHKLSSRAAMARLSRQSSSARAAEARLMSGANSASRCVRRAAIAASMSCAGGGGCRLGLGAQRWLRPCRRRPKADRTASAPATVQLHTNRNAGVSARLPCEMPPSAPGCGAAHRQSARSARGCGCSGSTPPAPPTVTDSDGVVSAQQMSDSGGRSSRLSAVSGKGRWAAAWDGGEVEVNLLCG